MLITRQTLGFFFFVNIAVLSIPLNIPLLEFFPWWPIILWRQLVDKMVQSQSVFNTSREPHRPVELFYSLVAGASVSGVKYLIDSWNLMDAGFKPNQCSVACSLSAAAVIQSVSRDVSDWTVKRTNFCHSSPHTVPLSKMSNWNFQHFDTQSDFGVVDENGVTHRVRKKPGRKANPAASAQRKVSYRR